ncbi:hypothetical protein KZZ52_41985 [Dactylosporangium sp. AC04546]|uniref:hypothetical protein n=1 Tax=Dactylosporangium sp. AC04546 TaxID=2862460 RepID=UPI001EE04671|nr:hypothetical protein [Dactylosporangium sp. AC04546]WVK80497.1 hypothetical protein KZZ52_41985 [Dactylosporangium sp. AC04546]
MRRIAALAVTLLLTLSGCGTLGSGGGTEPPADQRVSHEVSYDLFHSGGPGFKLLVSYTDASGRNATAETPTGTWSQSVTLQYPDVTTVTFGGQAAPDSGNQPPLGSQIPSTTCILWVDGSIVAQHQSLQPTCQAKLTASVAPPKSRSASPSR